MKVFKKNIAIIIIGLVIEQYIKILQLNCPKNKE